MSYLYVNLGLPFKGSLGRTKEQKQFERVSLPPDRESMKYGLPFSLSKFLSLSDAPSSFSPHHHHHPAKERERERRLHTFLLSFSLGFNNTILILALSPLSLFLTVVSLYTDKRRHTFSVLTRHYKVVPISSADPLLSPIDVSFLLSLSL